MLAAKDKRNFKFHEINNNENSLLSIFCYFFEDIHGSVTFLHLITAVAIESFDSHYESLLVKTINSNINGEKRKRSVDERNLKVLLNTLGFIH